MSIRSILLPAALLCLLSAAAIASPVSGQADATIQNATQRTASMPDTSVVASMTESLPSPAVASAPVVPTLSAQQLRDGYALTKLPNGLTVLIKKDNRFPLVSLRLYVHAGSSFESPEDAGISHVLEHMVFKGTDKFPKGTIAGEVESAGGYLNAATSFDYTVYLTDMTSEGWKKGLDVLKEMAFHATLDNDELTSEKDVIVAELNRGEDSPGSRLFRMMQGLIFKGTPYAHPIIGYEETIRSFTPERIRNYIDTHYQPQSMLLLIVGDVDMQEALKEAVNNFSGLANTRSVMDDALRRLEPTPTNFATDIQTGPWKKVNLALAFPAPDQNAVRSARLDVLSQLLGGDATSRFYRTYKYEKRLVDSISVANYGFERSGLAFVQVTLDPDKLVPFWKAFTKELAAISSVKFTDQEIERAKLNIEDGMYRSKETLPGLASKMGYFQFFSGGQEAEENYLNTVRGVNAAELAAEAEESFAPGKAALVALLPDEATLETYKLPKGSESVAAWLEAEFLKVLKPQAYEKEDIKETGPAEAEVVDLGPGRTVILLPDETLPYTAATLMFTGGNSLLTPFEQGLSTFTASLVGKGTMKLDAGAVEEFQSDRASSLSAASGRQSFTLSINGPSRYFADMFGLMRETIKTPAMKTAEADRVRENQIAGIVSTEDSPTGLAFRRMYGLLFPGHPYGYLQLGNVEGVAKFTAEKAKAFWKKQTAQPWVLSVCGSFDREEVLKLAAGLPTPKAKTTILDTPAWGDKKELDLSLPGRQQAHLLMIFPTAPIASEDEAGLDLLQNILSGQSGLLFRDLRDKQGLGYTVTALAMKTQRAGALVFYIGTEPDKMDQAKTGFEKVVAELKAAPLPEEELVRGKNQMAGDYYRERQRLGARSSEAATLFTLGLPLDAEQENIQKAERLTAEDLQAVAQKYLDPEKAYIIQVLP